MSVHLTTLPNGFRIVTDHMDAVETVSLGVWVDVGTRHEPAAINGVAHLLEHMAFKGTERRTALDIAEEIEDDLVRRVVGLADLLQDNGALAVELGRVEDRVL